MQRAMAVMAVVVAGASAAWMYRRRRKPQPPPPPVPDAPPLAAETKEFARLYNAVFAPLCRERGMESLVLTTQPNNVTWLMSAPREDGGNTRSYVVAITTCVFTQRNDAWDTDCNIAYHCVVDRPMTADEVAEMNTLTTKFIARSAPRNDNPRPVVADLIDNVQELAMFTRRIVHEER
jgi:hypothetical protein